MHFCILKKYIFFVIKFYLITELRYQPVLFHRFTSLNTVFIILFYKTAGLFFYYNELFLRDTVCLSINSFSNGIGKVTTVIKYDTLTTFIVQIFIDF